VVNEAMEFAMPLVVSSNVGAQHLVQHGKNGFIFPVGDAEALAGQLSELAESDVRRLRMGKASRARIEDETPARWADAVLRALGMPEATAAAGQDFQQTANV
jgi:glycosyltransferase involved in cell wall biosynthesis